MVRNYHDAIQTREEKKTEDWIMECEDPSSSEDIGKFEGRNEKKQNGCNGNIGSEVKTKWLIDE